LPKWCYLLPFIHIPFAAFPLLPSACCDLAACSAALVVACPQLLICGSPFPCVQDHEAVPAHRGGRAVGPCCVAAVRVAGGGRRVPGGLQLRPAHHQALLAGPEPGHPLLRAALPPAPLPHPRLHHHRHGEPGGATAHVAAGVGQTFRLAECVLGVFEPESGPASVRAVSIHVIKGFVHHHMSRPASGCLTQAAAVCTLLVCAQGWPACLALGIILFPQPMLLKPGQSTLYPSHLRHSYKKWSFWVLRLRSQIFQGLLGACTFPRETQPCQGSMPSLCPLSLPSNIARQLYSAACLLTQGSGLPPSVVPLGPRLPAQLRSVLRDARRPGAGVPLEPVGGIHHVVCDAVCHRDRHHQGPRGH
jgi:hypothetical protein